MGVVRLKNHYIHKIYYYETVQCTYRPDGAAFTKRSFDYKQGIPNGIGFYNPVGVNCL